MDDPEAPRQRARELAWRALNRRERTIAELRDRLAERGVEVVDAEVVIAELREGGYLDDAGFALRFAEDRRRLDDWGRDRIARRLRELGVGEEHLEAALEDRGPADEEAAALALLRRRFPQAPTARRDRDRALGVLVRRGHPVEVALAALRAHVQEAGTDAEIVAPEPGRY